MVKHQGNRLQYLMEKAGVNLVQAAVTLEISRSTLYNYFGMEEIPRKKLLKICEVTGIDINDVYQEPVVNDPGAIYKAQIKTLEEMVKAKDVIIIQQSEIIDLLKKSKAKPKRK